MSDKDPASHEEVSEMHKNVIEALSTNQILLWCILALLVLNLFAPDFFQQVTEKLQK